MKKAAFLFFRVEVGNAACAVQYLVVVQTMLVRCPKNLDFTVFQKVSLSNLIFYDSCRGNLYRFRYLNQEETASVFLSRKGHPILGEILSRNGEADLAFYSSRIKNEYDIENLPGHKDIWKILSVTNISKNKNGDSEVTINYLEFSNLTKDFKKREKTKTIVIKRKWDFYNELMDFLVEM